jgi:HEAT repeat protein
MGALAVVIGVFLGLGARLGGLAGAIWGVLALVVSIVAFLWFCSRWFVPPKRTTLARARECLAQLGDRRKRIRWRAANLLRGIGPDSKELLPELMAAMRHDDGMVRNFAIDAIARLGSDAKPAVSSLRTLVEGKSNQRFSAVCALWNICDGETDDEASASALAMAASDEEIGTRMYSAFAHWRITHRTEVVVPVLSEVLKHKSAPIRRSVPYLFSAYGPVPPEMLPAFRVALTDRDRSVRRLAAKVLEAAEANDRNATAS